MVKNGSRKQKKTSPNNKKHTLGTSGIRIINVGHENIDEANNLMMNKHAMVQFFHPQCGHCRTLKPTWNEMCFQMKKNYKGDAVIAAVDCSQQEMLNRLNIDKSFRGFPTIAHMHNGKHQHEFNDERTTDKLIEYAEDKLPIMKEVKRDLKKVVEPMVTKSITVRPSVIGPDFIGEEVVKSMRKTRKTGRRSKGKGKSKSRTQNKSKGRSKGAKKTAKKSKQSGGYRYHKKGKKN